ncbi:MAG: AI-2E family transporter [Gemmatimonadetes bacterium]|nr:AI-2E family transporter [Gemmatimonadota bacterium]
MEGHNDRLAPGAVARAVIVTLGLVALAWLLWSARDIVFIVFFGVLVALFLSVLVDPLVERGLPRIVATLLVVLALAGLFAGCFVVVWPTIREQLGVVAQDVPRAVDDLVTWVQRQFEAVSGQLADGDVDMEARLRENLTQEMASILGGAMPVLNTAMGAVAGGLVVLMTGIYIAVDPDLYRHGMERLLPPRHRARVGEALSRTASGLRGWMVGTAINMVVVGTITGIGLWLLGIPAAIALAVIAGLLEFIPIFGPILSAVPAVAVALTVSPMTALWVALLYTGVQQLEGNVITPVVMRGAVRLPPALTLLFLSFMGVIFGFLGLLLAVPILAAGIILVRALYVEPLEERSAAAR